MKARNHPVDFTRQAKKLAKHYARYLDALRKEYLRHNTSLYRAFCTREHGFRVHTCRDGAGSRKPKEQAE